ncbi:molybdate metabolism regulator [Methylobacterium sp. Leaf87]|uniref:DUF4132 domain-containing protein n=1 Tax=Methylobacterium sp. Leaf87 TaxID=1736243 RepID=UPI0006F682B0|nr:DUF4132 domain-containing protein [Methylobacterium sp. Leaf87]KQO56740.1 molybdate metabolism regulator [Methylobacterium sp. Leaf87]
MQRYELTEGSSSKFWDVGVEGCDLTVRFGRIGTKGQSKVKRFPEADGARQERDRLILEKTRKGYRPTTGETDATPAPAAIEVPPEAGPVSASAMPEAVQADRAIFSGTSLPTRTRPGPALDPAADWPAFVAAIRDLLDFAPEGADAEAVALAARLDREPPALDAAQARDWLDLLRAACPTMDQRFWGRKLGPRGPATRAAFMHFARWLVARSGIAPLVSLFDQLRPRPTSKYGTMPASVWDIPNSFGVRSALTAAPDADFDAALAACLRLHAEDPDPHLGFWLTSVLADDRAGADHALRAAAMLDRHGTSRLFVRQGYSAMPFIVDLPPSQAASWQADPMHKAILATRDVTAAEVAATMIAVAHAAGESATTSLVWLLRDAIGVDRTIVAKALLDTGAEEGLMALLPFTGAKLVRDALDAADIAFPDRMLPAYLEAMEGKGQAKGGPAYAPRAIALVGRHGAEAARAWAASGGGKLSGRLDRLLADDRPPAPREAWPSILRDPPWRRGAAARGRIALNLAPIPTPFAHEFDAAEAMDDATYGYRAGFIVEGMDRLVERIRETEAEGEAKYTRPIPPPVTPVSAVGTSPEAALEWLDRRLDRDGFGGFFCYIYDSWFTGVTWQPEPLALILWEKTVPLLALSGVRHDQTAAMVVRFGERALPGLVAIVAAEPEDKLPHVLKVDAAALTPIAARAFHRTKRARPAAVAWLRAHPRTAALRLLPDALGAPGPERDAADAALRFLASEPAGRAAFDAAVAAYAAIDPRVPEAVVSGVDSDPLDQVPVKPPKLPPWLVPAALPRPVLLAGGTLPDAAITAFCEMLAFSSPLTPYAGIAPVRAACTPESLDAFALAVFQSWLAAGANVAGEWAMRTLALIGGDACARDLTRQIRAWGQAGLKPRGKAGIAVLAGIGSDAALMNLSALAEKNPLLQLREAARDAIADAAETRGLDAVELADRLSPDLGLDARGGLDLSFGTRHFRVGFDETLRPWLRNADGQRLPALPRATKTDDPELAKQAAKLWAGLKKDAEDAGRLQISRLETMLATGRRIGPDVFQPFFAGHPLIRHLAGRLVWGLYEDRLATTAPRVAFRLAEDLTATDAEDAGLDLDLAALDGVVGLVHPLHLTPGTLAAWTALFADYEIAQPFPQLAREIYAFTPAEAAASATDRFDGVRVAGRRLRGLRSQGWSSDTASEHVCSVQRPTPLGGADLFAVLRFEDGLWHRSGPEGDEVQTLRALTLTETGWGASTAHRFGDLDPVTASEILRTPSLLAATGGE